MRFLCVAASAAVVFTLAAAPAAACCRSTAIYDVPTVVPPAGYLLAPPDRINPIYVANQGPIYSGPGIYTSNNIYVPSLVGPPYAQDRYSQVHPFYPYATRYPYVRSVHGWRCHARCGYGVVHAVGVPSNGY
jgi:hypothetical protein